MYKNGLTYYIAIGMLLLTHLSMLGIVFARGNEVAPAEFFLLTGGVIGLDLFYLFIMKYVRQMTYTLDILLLCVLNMGLIFQSCFGGVHLSFKHLLTCIAALIMCQLGFLLVRNHEWIRMQKKYIYILIVLLMLSVVFLTGDRGIWINIGSFSLQPSEFIKPCFVLICAASIVELHKKVKLGFFWVSKDTLYLCGITLFILALQWWSRDLGSLPTFAAVFACALVCRCCYPRAELPKTSIAVFGGVCLLVLIAAWNLAPSYVQDRLHVDIWADPYGNGYQQCQALIGIARGGWLGLGPTQGYLHNVFAYDCDIVFATVCEEWGLLYAFLLIIMILMMLMTPLMNPPKNYYHVMVAAGVTAVFVVQMALNIFGSCNLIPFTGVTLPFVSQGGSSMMTCGFLIGMLKATQSPLFRHENMKPKKKKPAKKPANAAAKGAKA